MVSLWPWKGEDSSPASFEKSLSTLSKKIAATQLQLDKQRSSSRRVKVIWTLYLSFAYLVYAIVLVLVVGWKNLGPWEWTGLAGGPVFIYVTRTITNAYFTFRIDSLESKLKAHQNERAKTIQKLKDATKYDSTLELLEKYGGEKPKPNRTNSGQASADTRDDQKKDASKRGGRASLGQSGGRTAMPPPPTANIQRPTSTQGTPQQHRAQAPFQKQEQTTSPIQYDLTAEFAPNAGDLPLSHAQYEYHAGPPHWYDRILDLMMGDDETAAKNRIVLICQKCRLVNGQAPPGSKTLTDVGQWKCMSCGTLNGEMDEGKKIMREVLNQHKDVSSNQSDIQSGGTSSDAKPILEDSTGDESTGEDHIQRNSK